MYLSSGTLPCVDFLDVSYHGRYTNSLCVYYACQRSGSPPTVWGGGLRLDQWLHSQACTD